MKPKQWCPGAGKLAPLTAPPSSLVTCPVCNRRNLNGELPSYPGYYGVDDLRDADGNDRYEVPCHRAKPTQPEDIR